MTQSTQAGPSAGYETTFITRAELSDDALKALQDSRTASSATSRRSGLSEDWGRRKLA